MSRFGDRTLCLAMCGMIAATGACSEQAAPDGGGIETICGVENVEDMVKLPGSPWIIGSGIGDTFFQRGGLHLINEDTGTASRVELIIPADLVPQAPYDQCPAPADAMLFSAHGLSLMDNTDGSHRLFVVNHGRREAIEVFDVNNGEGGPQFQWIGCVPTPATAHSNAVAVRTDGSLVMSASTASDTPLPSFAQLAANPPDMSAVSSEGGQMPKGAVFIWRPEEGWSKVPDSELGGNNGIELSKDGQWAFVNSWPGASVTYMPLDPALGSAREIKLRFKPDNIRWSHDGKLVAAGHLADVPAVAACVMGDGTGCDLDYSAAQIDPESFAVTTLYDGKGTQDFGTATIALKTKKALWLGSVRSKCIARVTH